MLLFSCGGLVVKGTSATIVCCPSRPATLTWKILDRLLPFFSLLLDLLGFALSLIMPHLRLALDFVFIKRTPACWFRYLGHLQGAVHS